MVRLTIPLYLSNRLKKHFLDNIRIYVRGGAGGQGLSQYGGIGGSGGNVYVKATEGETLKRLTQQNENRRFVAASGKNSKHYALLGKPGKDIQILVPPGVCITNDAGRILGEVNVPGDQLLIAKGAPGGSPQTNFLSQKAPAIHLRLDLKLIADIGLVGFPNAGKSTLLAAMSRASPKIASYAFTTIQPQIGMMEYDDRRQISMADLPGLIEGAHINVGMGHRFLKHVERTKVLLFVVDLHGFQLNPRHPFRSALDTVLLLNKELELYKPELLTKPAVLALNKIDLAGSEAMVAEVKEQIANLDEHLSTLEPDFRPKKLVTFDDIIPISAKMRESTDQLKERMRHLLDVYADIEQAEGDTGIGPKITSLVESPVPGGMLV